MTPAVLMIDAIGGAYTARTLEARALGGSEIEMLQVSSGLAGRGHRVVVANGVLAPIIDDGVQFVPLTRAHEFAPSRALYLQRTSTPLRPFTVTPNVHTIVRANDVYFPGYDVHRSRLASGATLVANTNWQAQQFTGIARTTAVIPPMLEPMPLETKDAGLYVFASGDMKGRAETIHYWKRAKDQHHTLTDARLVVLSPGWGSPYVPSPDDSTYAISSAASHPAEYRRWIARAEALFMVLRMPETFCCAAALAERAGTRVHVLCLAGRGGLDEALQDTRYVTDDPEIFLGTVPGVTRDVSPVMDLTPAAVLPQWERTLHLVRPAIAIQRERLVGAATETIASKAVTERRSTFFGELLSETLPNAIEFGGSEFGIGLMLFALAAAIRAKRIVEIGRFKGFSTLALAAACRLQAEGWPEPSGADQRSDVDYAALRDVTKRALVLSIDPNPQPEAEARLRAAGLFDYVDLTDLPSADVAITGPIDFLLIDGDHSRAGIEADVRKYVPLVRPSGYVLLHDYFGWFDGNGQNGSAVPGVVSDLLAGFDRVLIDTGFASAVLLRKTSGLTLPKELEPPLSRVQPRADGRPTVGLCLIAKGDEASTVVARAIVSAQKAGVDCVTLVCDAPDATADVARQLGAVVVVRPTPPTDWTRGIGWIAAARNEALALAEVRTDYVLAVDADDWFEGTLPATLDRDAYELVVQDGGLRYPRLQLFRSATRPRYEGIIHEYVPASGSIGRLETLTYRRGGGVGYQDREPPAVKFAKHAQLARQWLAGHPDDSRMQFYLGRSLHDAGQWDAALDAYERRVQMIGWEEERAYAALEIGRIHLAQGKDPTVALLRAHALDPRRAEPLVLLAQWYRHETRRQFSTAYAFAKRAAELPQPETGLFLNPAIYQYEALVEVAVCAYWLGRKVEARNLFQQVATCVPPAQRVWAQEMIALCAREIEGA